MRRLALWRTTPGRSLRAKSTAWLVALFLAGAAGFAQARFEGVARAGDWTLYRDNITRPFDNFATPLVMGTLDRRGTGALALQCRPDTGVFGPTRYFVSGGFLFLNFAPDVRRLLSNPWRAGVAVEVEGTEFYTPYALRLPFVSGLLLEKLAADVDALYDEAETVLLIPPWTMRSLEKDMRDGRKLLARVYSNDGQRVELSFSLDGYSVARDALEAACAGLNEHGPG